MLLKLQCILDKIFDMPRWKRMPCIFLFVGSLCALAYFFIAGAILIWFIDLDSILTGALAAGICGGLVNMVIAEYLKGQSICQH